MQSIGNIYLLKDLSRLSGHSTHTLKFYLKRGLITEAGRTPQTRFRYFNDATVARLSAIRALRKQQKSLSEITQLLNGAEGRKPKAEGERASASGLGPPASLK